MRIYPHFLTIKANPHFYKSGVFISFLSVFFTLFMGQLLSAQNIVVKEKSKLAVITLQNGAQIYSGDESFNQQVKQERIIFNKASSKVTQVLEKKYLVITTEKKIKTSKSTLALQLKKAETEKKENLTKKIQKQIAEHKERTKGFLTVDLKSFPPSTHFSVAQSDSKNYISPRTDYQTDSKIYFDETYYVKVVLDDLHSRRFNYYNNKSLSFCFSQVFSVRPPPMLVI